MSGSQLTNSTLPLFNYQCNHSIFPYFISQIIALFYASKQPRSGPPVTSWVSLSPLVSTLGAWINSGCIEHDLDLEVTIPAFGFSQVWVFVNKMMM